MKIIFMGTPNFAVKSLEAIHECGHEILLVVSQEDKVKGRGKKLVSTPVKEKALELGLKVFQPRRIKDKESVDRLRELKPDLIVVTAYGQILSKEILDIPKYGCVNVHASLLPKYRGAAPINFAIINGEKVTGITTMLMDEGLDTGDMLLHDEISIEPIDTAETLFLKLSILGKETLKRTLDLIEKEEMISQKQDDTQATYAMIMNKELGHINWNDSAERIVNLCRGTQPWPGVFSFYKDEVVKFFDIKVGDKTLGKSGEIIRIEKDYIEVMAGDRSVCIYSVQFPNKRRMLVSEYLKGNNVEISSILS
ncbi:MAG: methionyl-tRNA formyltransferase [Filifactoraceae bacterium]